MKTIKKIGIAACVLLVLLLFSHKLSNVISKETVTVTVTKTESKVDPETQEYTYFVYTDKGVFKNQDDTWEMKWNSSDVYSKLVENKKYEMVVVGYRVRWLSWYQNIITVKEVQ